MATKTSATQAAYSGIAFPPRKAGGSGFFYTETDEDLIRSNIKVILGTKKGSMPMNSEFGNSSHDLLFEPISEVTQSLIADLLKVDIERWETRVTVASIKAASINNTRIFELILRIKATGQTMTYVATF
jgi:phage baseplate assembly protein W